MKKYIALVLLCCFNWVLCLGQLSTQLVVTPPNQAPITNPVDNLFLCQGSSATLNVVVTGAVGSVSYQWFFADNNGIFAIAGATSATYNNASQEGEYFVRVSDTNNPSGVFSQSIAVCVYSSSPINVTISSTNNITNLCSVGTTGLTLSASAQNPAPVSFCGLLPIQYTWLKGGNIVGTGQTYQVPNSPTSAGIYTLRASNPCGFAEATINISVVDAPPQQALIQSQDNSNSLCIGGSIRLNALAQGQGLSYQWFRNGTAINGANGLSLLVNYNALVSYPETYKVRVSNGCGFIESPDFQVFLDTPPANVQIQPLGNTSFCNDSGVSLLPSASGSNPLRYEWYRNNVLVQTYLFPFNQGITYQARESGDYVLVVHNKCGRAESAPLNIRRIVAPTQLTIRGLPTLSVGCGQTTLQLQALHDGDFLRFEWYKDNVLVQNSTNLTLNFQGLGLYQVKAVAEVSPTNICGQMLSEVVQITEVNQAPSNNITLTSAGLSTCNGQILLTASATGLGLQYEWYKDNVLFATTAQNTYQAKLSGAYKVRVSNACGTSAFSNTLDLSISTPPQGVSIQTASPTSGCSAVQPVPLNAVATGSTGVTLYEWFRNGQKVGEGIQYTATQNGAYLVRATNACGDIESQIIEINFTQAPTQAVIIPQSTPTLCGSLTIPLSVQTNGNNLIYRWLKNGTVVSTEATYLANDIGSYVVQLINGCGTIVSQPFIINSATSLVTPTIFPLTPPTLCAGGSLTLTANTPVVGATFRWYRNNQLIAGANTATLQVREAGIYVVETSKDNCSVLSQGRQINTTPQPTLLLTYRGSLSFCEGDSVRLQVRSQDATMQYSWEENNQVLQTGNTFVAKKAGEYIVRGTNSCGTTLSTNFSINTQNRLSPTIAWQDGRLVVLDSARSYQWFFNGFPILNQNNRILMPLEAGSYKASISSELGCVGTSEAIEFAGWNTQEAGEVQVMPNPNAGQFSVRILSTHTAEIALLTHLGQNITSQTMQRANSLVSYQQFDFEGLTQGIYILKVQLGNKTIGRKIIVIK